MNEMNVSLLTNPDKLDEIKFKIPEIQKITKEYDLSECA
jgi:hypothetical protein